MLSESHLYREIHEQPATLARLLSSARPAVERLARLIQQDDINHVIIAARGTSDNAGRYAQYALGANNRLTVSLATPSLFTIYGRPPRVGKALVLGISQSGKSPDIVAVLAEARRQGAPTAAITNEPASELAQEADVVVELGAGVERAVAATKTYTAELMAIALLSAVLSGDEGMGAALEAIPEVVGATLESSGAIGVAAPRYRYMERCVVIGRGYNYATAYELALKLKELTYTIVEPYSSADFLHGPIALVENGFPVIVIAPSGIMQPEMVAFMEKVGQRQGEIIAISDDEATLGLARIGFRLPEKVDEWLSPIPAIVAGQLFAMHLAHTRDFDVDRPRGLTKVTETH
jgi:glucosamine--fructose-6-phosphate aminotransferase (isomerizing)